jgi:YidC/Oxa1 family membrane protein insertase
MSDNRNLIIAVAISIVLVIGYDFFIGSQYRAQKKAAVEQAQQAALQNSPIPADTTPVADTPAANATTPTAADSKDHGAHQPTVFVNRSQALAQNPRLPIENTRVSGSMSLKGAIIDDLVLTGYTEKLDPESEKIHLLQPKGTAASYRAEFGWSGVGIAKDALPNANTIWRADTPRLTPQTPVTLTWDNGKGLIFTRKIALDQDYMFTVTDSVTNTGDAAVTMANYGLISRNGTPALNELFIMHEGPLGVFDEVLEEVAYKDLREDGNVEKTTTGGWVGITDKYWLTALAFDQKDPVKTRFSHATLDGQSRYQVDYLGSTKTIAPGATIITNSHFFAGAKEVTLLDKYTEQYNIPNFDLAIDFGWFYFLTKPFFLILNAISGIVGNFGVAILLFTVLLKLLFFPLANKSYRSMAKMKKIQPELKKLQQRYKDDKMKLQQEMMALYKREKANPVAGCLPMLIQIPVFFSLYKVLYVTIEMRHAPFFGWIKDLSAPDPTNVFNLFGLLPFDPPSMLHIGVWPLIMGVSMLIQQRLNPAPMEKIQARMMMMMPVVFTVLLANFSAGLVIYWAWNNTLSIAQQWVIMRQTNKS